MDLADSEFFSMTCRPTGFIPLQLYRIDQINVRMHHSYFMLFKKGVGHGMS